MLFYGILIYSSSLLEHLCHVCAIFVTLRAHNLIFKSSKCAFAELSMVYLGHVISVHGVAMDPTKVEVLQHWS